jgi:integrase
MMAERLPYTYQVTVKGNGYWRFRSKETGDVKLPGSPADPQFHQKYADLLALRNRVAAAAAGTEDEESWAWLIGRYLNSPEYRALADCTQVDYAATCALLEGELGPHPFRFTTRAMVKAVRDDFAATPRKANKIQQMTSRLYSWAQEGELVPEGFNPAKGGHGGLKKLKRKGGEREILPWSDAEVAWVLEAAPAHVVTPVLLALYTGQRREDVVGMTWQQWQGDFVRVRTSKTGALIDMPCHPVLKAHLEQLRAEAKVISLAGPICLTAAGIPFASANALSGAVRRVVEAHPRVPNRRSMHGLRYAAAGRMEEGGANIAAIEAVLGHRTFRMAMKYASARLRAAQGIAAMKG